MPGRILPLAFLTLLVLGIFTSSFYIQSVKAIGTIYIRTDGSIDPATAPIQRNGDLYTLTDNIASSEDGIVMMRNNTMVDGGGYTVQSAGTTYNPVGIDLTGTNNVTIKKMNVKAFYRGIQLISSDNNSVSENSLTNNTNGIALSYSNNNSMSGNTIAHSRFGVDLLLSDNNSISANTFFDCGLTVFDSYENVVFDNLVNGKPLVYLEDVSDCVVEDAGQVILVNCNRIRVENSNLSHTTLGVELWQTNNTKIGGNTVTDNQFYGIYLYYSSDNSISENNMANNSVWGIFLRGSSNNRIDRNNITDNSYCGIEFGSSSYNSVSGNDIIDNGNGIWLGGSSYNSISENNITNNGVDGIVLKSSSNNSISGNDITDNGYYCIDFLDSSINTVFHNDFINNTVHVDYWTSEHANFWDNCCEGNYWSDYNGTDLDNDGVGDTYLPWEGVDNYPLMNVYWNPCDINHDLEVNRDDIDISARAFGTRSGDVLWNPHADVTGSEPLVSDGKVDMRDISVVARHFGEHYP
jgi:parallel beta-helix repeat protein